MRTEQVIRSYRADHACILIHALTHLVMRFTDRPENLTTREYKKQISLSPYVSPKLRFTNSHSKSYVSTSFLYYVALISFKILRF